MTSTSLTIGASIVLTLATFAFLVLHVYTQLRVAALDEAVDEVNRNSDLHVEGVTWLESFGNVFYMPSPSDAFVFAMLYQARTLVDTQATAGARNIAADRFLASLDAYVTDVLTPLHSVAATNRVTLLSLFAAVVGGHRRLRASPHWDFSDALMQNVLHTGLDYETLPPHARRAVNASDLVAALAKGTTLTTSLTERGALDRAGPEDVPSDGTVTNAL